MSFDINQCPPMLDPMDSLGVQAYDVLRIKNVPYTVTIPEIKAFVHRLTSAPLIKEHEQGYPVHIIMERPTGKTMECYVEFQNKGAVRIAVERAESIISERGGLKMGIRHVTVEASSEGELCAALFPRAKSVIWNPETGVPTVTRNLDPYSEGFQGFLTIEEVVSVCKFSANPQKSTFIERCQQRVYESMISTLYKFPWHAPLYYMVNTRNFIFAAYMEMLTNLVARVQPPVGSLHRNHSGRVVGLNHTLLMDFLFAGMNVQMFTLRQKECIIKASGPIGPGFYLPRQTPIWSFHSLLLPRICAPDSVDEWLNILNAGYHRMIRNKVAHQYSQWAELSRHDHSGTLEIGLTHDGRAMSFRDLISMEKGLVKILVEHGRMEWCEHFKMPYRPLNLWEPTSFVPYSHELDVSEQSVNQPFGAGRAITSKEDNHYDSDESSGMGEPIPNDPEDIVLSGDEDDNIPKAIGPVTPARTPLAAANRFNPATPSFIPHEPWSDINPDRKGSTYSGGGNDLRDCPRDNPHRLTSAVETSWTFAQAFPDGVPRQDDELDVSTPRQQPGSAESRQSYDPFSADVSPHSNRRGAIRSGHSSASTSPANSGTLVRKSGHNGSNQSDVGAVGNRKRISMSCSPLFDSVWGAGVGNAAPHAIPYRRVSGESSANNLSQAHQLQSQADTPTRQPKTDIGYFAQTFTPAPQATATNNLASAASVHTLPSSSFGTEHATFRTPNYKLPASSDSGRSWLRDSPRRGDRTSSTSRNTIYVQATIEEEDDMSEHADGAGDTNNDAGGVSLAEHH